MLSDDFLAKIREILNNYEEIGDLNKDLQKKTGLIDFFISSREIDEFIQFINNFNLFQKKSKDLGDFQTPSHLTDKICSYFIDFGFIPDIIIEPTCGQGTFVISALKFYSSLKYVYCIEIQKEYEWLFKLQLLNLSFKKNITANIEFHRDNIFTHHFSSRFLHFLDNKNQNFLILGNPPWITNTELSILNSNNVPFKLNIKQDRGIDAITGKGNFDIAEYIICQMIQEFSNKEGKIAMLCKTSVVKNIVKDMRKLNLKLSNIKLILIDAKKEFNINAEAGLFMADIGHKEDQLCTVSSLYQPNQISKKFGWIDNKFVSNISLYNKYRHLEGKSPFIWRQGVKHDAVKVMILTMRNGIKINGLQEEVIIENDLLFPFIKGSDLKSMVIKKTERNVIITQTNLKEKTDYIALNYPKLWDYLISHSKYLNNRKSMIYKNRPRFSIFGIGDYAFKPFKIAISGFYKTSKFSFIFPIENKPVMLDDTCYFLSFDKFEDAFFTWIIMNLDSTKEFLSSITFLDTKRPYNKEILMRIDLAKLANIVTFNTIFEFYKKNLQKYFTYLFNEKQFVSYCNFIKRL